jgi:hypothetical protein
VDWTTDAAVSDVNLPMDVQTSNAALRGSTTKDSTAPTVHWGGEGQVEAEE